MKTDLAGLDPTRVKRAETTSAIGAGVLGAAGVRFWRLVRQQECGSDGPTPHLIRRHYMNSQLSTIGACDCGCEDPTCGCGEGCCGK